MPNHSSITRAGVFLLAVFAALFLWASPAFADGEPVAAKTGTVVLMSATLWALVQGTVIPILVGILTKVTAEAGVKILVSIVLNAIGAIINTVAIVEGVAVLSTQTLVNGLVGLIATIAIHYGVFKQIEVTGSTVDTNALAPTKGLG